MSIVYKCAVVSQFLQTCYLVLFLILFSALPLAVLAVTLLLFINAVGSVSGISGNMLFSVAFEIVFSLVSYGFRSSVCTIISDLGV